MYVEERGRRGKESGVEMEMDEGWNENRMGERGWCGKEWMGRMMSIWWIGRENKNEKMNENGVE